VHGRPDPAAGVLGEHGRVVIGLPIGVELGRGAVRRAAAWRTDEASDG
jgi:hypothetical protein